MQLLKITILSLAITNLTFKTNAQTYNRFLLANFKIFGAAEPYNSTPPFELLLIKTKSNTSGMRYGFNVIHTPYNIYTKPDIKIGDTMYSEYKKVSALIPRISIGKEWYKNIHQDIKLYIGFDGVAGAMQNKTDSSFSKDYPNGSTTYGIFIKQPVLNYSIETRPFMGLRTAWGRFMVGYQAGIPIQFLKQERFGADIDLLHQIQLGYAFNKRKKVVIK
jgi:hypothetical protein